jgi:hypothetical protein
MALLDEKKRATGAEHSVAEYAYGRAFPDGDRDWMHPALVGTVQCVELMNEAVQRGAAITEEEVERRFGPLSWAW